MSSCARKGCRRLATGDAFCSTYCAKVANGIIDPMPKSQRAAQQRGIRKLEELHGPYVEMDNPHVSRVAHPGSGHRRHDTPRRQRKIG